MKVFKDFKIAYISTDLPSLTSTFIYREIVELRKQGYKVEIFSIWKPSVELISEEVRRLIDETHYIFPTDYQRYPTHGIRKLFRDFTTIRSSAMHLLLAQIIWLFSSPVKYLKVFKLALFCNPEPPQKIVKKLKLIYHFFISASLAQDISHCNISHFHAHFAYAPTNIAMFASKLLDITFSFTAHAQDIYQGLYIYDMKTQIKQSTFVNVISEYNKNYLIEKFGARIGEKLKVIYYGVDCDAYVPMPNKNITDGTFRILSIGRLVDKKGHEYLIGACNILKSKGYKFKCEIIGDGVLKKELQDMIYRLGLVDSVELKGAVLHDTIPDLIKKAHIFVLSCIVAKDQDRDGIPNVLIESMALGVPVISTGILGIPELIEHGKTGFLVPQRNPQELADAVALLIGDNNLQKKLVKNAREKIVQDFNIRDNVAKLSSLFKSKIYYCKNHVV